MRGFFRFPFDFAQGPRQNDNSFRRGIKDEML